MVVFHGSQIKVFAAIADETQDSLMSLEESGLGAIYLRSAASPFQFKSLDGQQHGELLSTGIYLRENGSVGTIQRIDLFA